MIICIVIVAMLIAVLAIYAVVVTTKVYSLCATNDELRQSLNAVEKELHSCRRSATNHRDNVYNLFVSICKVWEFWESKFPDKFSVPISDFIRELLGCSEPDYVSYNAAGQINKYTELCLKLQEEVYDRYVMRKAENSTQEAATDDSQGTC